MKASYGTQNLPGMIFISV